MYQWLGQFRLRGLTYDEVPVIIRNISGPKKLFFILLLLPLVENLYISGLEPRMTAVLADVGELQRFHFCPDICLKRYRFLVTTIWTIFPFILVQCPILSSIRADSTKNILLLLDDIVFINWFADWRIFLNYCNNIME